MENIYFDNASTTFPKPPKVAESVFAYMTSSGVNINRGCYNSAYDIEEIVLDTRQLLCDLFDGPDCRNVIFTKNVTESLNVILKGFLKSGDHVLVSSMEHNAVMRPLVQLESVGVSFTRIPCKVDGSLIVDEMANCLQPNTKAIVMMHASNVCGTIMPIQEVGRFCHEHNLKFIVDCAQTGGVLPISMKEMHIDALAFTGHKGLLGPQGIGGFILAEGMEKLIDPLLSGGTGSISHTEEVPEFMPDRFEPGTMNLPGIIGLHESLLWLKETGLEAIRLHELNLTGYFLKGLAALARSGDIRIVGKTSTDGRTGIVSIQTLKKELSEVSYELDDIYGIMTRVGLHCAPIAHKTLETYPTGTIRFSFGYWNTEEQVEKALQALEEICHGS